MGALRPPNPPTAERGGAIYWRMPQLTAPLFSATDERYGFVKIPRGARGGMGACPHHKINPSDHQL